MIEIQELLDEAFDIFGNEATVYIHNSLSISLIRFDPVSQEIKIDAYPLD